MWDWVRRTPENVTSCTRSGSGVPGSSDSARASTPSVMKNSKRGHMYRHCVGSKGPVAVVSHDVRIDHRFVSRFNTMMPCEWNVRQHHGQLGELRSPAGCGRRERTRLVIPTIEYGIVAKDSAEKLVNPPVKMTQRRQTTSE